VGALVATRGARASVIALLFAVTILIPACSSGGSGPPGSGNRIADHVYSAVKPVAGEAVAGVPPGSPTKCLADRLDEAFKSDPEWTLARRTPAEPRGTQYVERLVFKDRSSLTLVQSLGADGGPILDIVEIARP
jgi:hypothetical protein